MNKYRQLKHSYYLLLPILILLVFLIQHTFKIGLLGIAGICLLFGSVFLLNVDHFIYAFAILLPNTYIIKLLGFNAALTGYWLMLITLRLLLTNHRSFRLQKNLILHLSLHVICLALSVFFTQNTEIVLPLLRFICLILLTNHLISSRLIHLDKLIQNFILGNVLNVLCGVFYYVLNGLNLFSGHFSGIGNDRNYFAITLAFSVNLLLVYLRTKKKVPFSFVIQLLLLYGGIFLSGSRTALLISLPAFLILLSIFARGARFTVRKFLIVLILLIGSVAAYSLLSESISHLFERFTKDSYSGGNGRFEAWFFYLAHGFSSLASFLFGYGDSEVLVKSGAIPVVEHNVFLQTFFTIGILGAITLFIVYKDLFRLFVPRRSRTGFLSYVPMFSIVIGYCTINGLYSDNLTFCFILSCAVLSVYISQKPDERSLESAKAVIDP